MTPSTTDVLNQNVMFRPGTPVEPSVVRSLRREANERDHACAASLSEEADTHLVVSPRGTCVLLDDFLKADSWPPSEAAGDVAREVTRQIA